MSDTLQPGVYRVRSEWEGTTVVEEGETVTEMEAVDDALKTSEVVNWEVRRIDSK